MARRWASGRGSARPEDAGDPITAELLRRRAATTGGRDDAIEIGTGEADVANLFFAMGTQWRRAGMSGVRVGLDYEAIPLVAAGIGVRWRPLFADLQVMERAALTELAR